MSKQILIVEDDSDILLLMKLQLQTAGYSVETTTTISQATQLLSKQKYDLHIIDRMLPDGQGTELCKQIRNELKLVTPIIIVTALSRPEHIIEGLDAGADDYIVKPFDIHVFQARIRAQLRRLEQKISKEIIIGELKVSPEKCQVWFKDEELFLTNTEFQILLHLVSKPGIVQTRESLIKSILGDEVHVTNRTIDTHMVSLRKKIKEAANYIETIRGVGYRCYEQT